MPIEVIREGAFGGTYFIDICASVKGKWYKKSCKEFDHLMKQILAVGFSAILDTGQVENHKMMKEKLIGGKKCKQVQR